MEGWFVGCEAVSDLSKIDSFAEDEFNLSLSQSEKDYRILIQESLFEYSLIWKKFDKIWHLKSSQFNNTILWKSQQEGEMIKLKGSGLKGNNLSNFISNIEQISENLNSLLYDEKNKLISSIDNFNLFMEKMPSVSSEIDDILLDINVIVKNLNNGDGTLSLMLNDDELYKNVNGLVLDARLLLEDVKENPTKYLRAWFEAKKK